AGARARGATLYSTLEPCSHYGQTPPCVDAVIAAGVKRVVVGIEDPDPRVAGRGLERMRQAGIAVTCGVLARQCDWAARGHILRVTERRPFVQVKMALDVDGSVPRGGKGRPSWVTGAAARAHGHLLRARADAIAVGRVTVQDDDPDLTCRLPGLVHRSPIRVVLAGRGLPSPRSRLVLTAGHHPVWIIAGPHADPSVRGRLERAGCRFFDVASVGDRPWLPAAMEALVAAGVTRLLVEGGPTLWRAFFDSGIPDEVVQYRRGEGGAAAAERDLLGYVRRDMFELVFNARIGGDGLYVFRRRRGA
ncbi:MAG TPA: bifunctional diaminohydroxyphosphoribosylaminopyrimidine deaminase/5-amino-6-(5-phosphoribosylamino)uracil reductase RibD, partial [Hyphomicrobiaceae bacterium]|nr:bifunctional diaminohydroxyphosphoribosylaminopyrimidine deaminase/5-amino-6-(5-phosphoribosylamino)uracil reductase RibD [Hyphomicrobiaceae bacterium]